MKRCGGMRARRTIRGGCDIHEGDGACPGRWRLQTSVGRAPRPEPTTPSPARRRVSTVGCTVMRSGRSVGRAGTVCRSCLSHRWGNLWAWIPASCPRTGLATPPPGRWRPTTPTSAGSSPACWTASSSGPTCHRAALGRRLARHRPGPVGHARAHDQRGRLRGPGDRAGRAHRGARCRGDRPRRRRRADVGRVGRPLAVGALPGGGVGRADRAPRRPGYRRRGHHRTASHLRSLTRLHEREHERELPIAA